MWSPKFSRYAVFTFGVRSLKVAGKEEKSFKLLLTYQYRCELEAFLGFSGCKGFDVKRMGNEGYI